MLTINIKNKNLKILDNKKIGNKTKKYIFKNIFKSKINIYL